MTPTSRALLRDLGIAVFAVGIGVALLQFRAPRTVPVVSSPVFIRNGADRDFDALTLWDLPSVDGGFTSGVRYGDEVFLMTYGRLLDPVPARILRYRIADGALVAQLNPRWGACVYPVNLSIVRDTLYLACRTPTEPVTTILAIDLTTDRARRTYGERDGFRPSAFPQFRGDGETLWVGGDHGIARINTAHESLSWYGEERGVPPGFSHVYARGGSVRAMVQHNRSISRIRYDPTQDRWITCAANDVSTDGTACSWYGVEVKSGEDPDATIEVRADRVRVKIDGAWRVVPLRPRVYYAMSPQIRWGYFLFSSDGVELFERGQAFPTLVGKSAFDLRPYQRNVWPERDDGVGLRTLLVSNQNRRYVVILYAIVKKSDRTVRSYTIGAYDRLTRRYVEGRLDAEDIPESSPWRDYYIATGPPGGIELGLTARARNGEVEVVANDVIHPGLGLTINLTDGRVRPLPTIRGTSS